MTHAQKIREAVAALDEALTCVSGSILPLDMQILKQRIIDLQFVYATAWTQATEVADENLARAQKLAEQVQDNVKHIERMAEQMEEHKADTNRLNHISENWFIVEPGGMIELRFNELWEGGDKDLRKAIDLSIAEESANG